MPPVPLIEPYFGDVQVNSLQGHIKFLRVTPLKFGCFRTGEAGSAPVANRGLQNRKRGNRCRIRP